MNRRLAFKTLNHHLFTALVLAGLILVPMQAGVVTGSPMVDVIVQGVAGADVAALVESYGGQVTRELSVIDAVAAGVPLHQMVAMGRAPGVTRVWPDVGVQITETADPGVLYAPVSGGEAKRAGFDLHKVAACDGDKDNMDEIPLNDLSPFAYQAYVFTPTLDPNNLPQGAALHLVFKEKSLNHAQLQVRQASTQMWHTFDIDTLSTNDQFIDVTLDVSSALGTPEDLGQVEVRFLVSRNEGGEKAEIDCANLQVGDVVHPPVTGWEVKSASFDLRKVTVSDGDKDNLDEIPINDINPHFYQVYTFVPRVDPNNLPGVADLHFIFKEKSLNHALLQVYQASTRTWHTFEIDTLSTNDKYIDTMLDLTDVLETPEDYAQVEVRFMASRNDGGEKAEVDLVSLFLADLVGDTTADVASAFEGINAASVWGAGNTGGGIGVAVLDSGVKTYKELEKDTRDQKTGLKKGWNALENKEDGHKDKNGHGTLVASVASNQKRNNNGKYFGVAPDSVIIPVQVLDEEGKGSYSQVIAGIQWVIDHKHEYNIRVMNLSLSAPVRSHYWDDPLNQAVMRAWAAGIVVVVAAGNGGPDPMSIGVPGNVPYVITVGALTDAHTPSDWSDDYVPPFSAAGPTYEGFVKPDLIAPGARVVGLMSDKCKLAKDHPDYKLDKDYYKLSGTSMSAAQVSGVVALMLARNPGLTPDQVKYRLLASAVPALYPDGTLTFSIWQQGAGRVDAYAVVYGDYAGVANQGLDVAADLAGTQHFGGYTRWDPETNQYYLVDEDGHAWSDGYAWGGGHAWSDQYTWGGGHAWSDSVDWNEAITALVTWVPLEAEEATPQPRPEPTATPQPTTTPEPTATPAPTPEPTPEPTAEPSSATMHVADLDGAGFPDGDFWRAFLVVTASDSDGVPVSGATIAMSVWAEGNLWAKTVCTTDARGRCVVSPSVRPLITGIVFRVEGMAHSNFVYQPAHNTDPDADSDGTQIKISRPW